LVLKEFYTYPLDTKSTGPFPLLKVLVLVEALPIIIASWY